MNYDYSICQGWVQVQLYLSNLYLSTIFEYLHLYLNTFLFIPMYLYLYLSTYRKYLKFEVQWIPLNVGTSVQHVSSTLSGCPDYPK